MVKKTYEIKYKDPETGEIETAVREFDDSAEFPAKLWAEDYGYAKADKGWYSVKELV